MIIILNIKEMDCSVKIFGIVVFSEFSLVFFCEVFIM